MPTPDLLILAEVNLDLVVDCGTAPIEFGQVETLVENATLTLGSSGAITAAAAAAQGCRVALVGVVGADEPGDMARQRLAQLGVDVSGLVRRADLRTGMTIVLTRPGGDRALLTFPGAMTALTADLVDRGLTDRAGHIHVSSPFLQKGLQPGLPDLFRAARTRGVTTSIDPGWDPDDQWTAVRDLLPEVDYLLPNAAECRRLAPDAADELAAAQALAARGPKVVLKLGAQGGVLIGPTERIRVLAEPTRPVDTTGAGDNFDAGFLAGLLDGNDPATALARAVATGSLAVTGIGGTGRLGTRQEVLAAAERLHVTGVDPVFSPHRLLATEETT